MLKRMSRILILFALLFPAVSKAQPDVELLEAIVEGDVKGVDRRLKSLGPEFSDSTGGKALRAALEHGRVTILRRVIAAGVDLNTTYQDGKTPLDIVAGVPWPDLIERLLKAGPKKVKGGAEEINSRPLFAVAKEDPQALEEWLAGSPDSVAMNVVGKLGLWWASKKPNLELMQLLLNAGVDPDLRDELGTTMLMSAVSEGRPEMTRLLSEAGADFDLVNRKGKTPMMLAEDLGHDEILAIMIKSRISRKKRRVWE